MVVFFLLRPGRDRDERRQVDAQVAWDAADGGFFSAPSGRSDVDDPRSATSSIVWVVSTPYGETRGGRSGSSAPGSGCRSA